MRRVLAAIAALMIASVPIGFAAAKSFGARIGRDHGLTSDRIRIILASAQLQSGVGDKLEADARCSLPLSIKASEVSPTLKNVVLWQEDRKFMSHDGSSLLRVLNALARTAGSVVGLSKRQGGSTITQQLVKNTVFVAGDPTWKRKLLEPGYAKLFEDAASKDEIFAAYLNTVTFLDDVTGVEAFSQRYFGKKASDMTLLETAQFARAINSPARFDPRRHPSISRDAALKLLAEMRKADVINAEAWQAAVKQAKRSEANVDTPVRVGCQYLREAVKALGPPLPTGTHRVYVTIEARREVEALRAVDAHASSLTSAGGSEVGFVSLGADGRVQALASYTNTSSSTWDAALQARRQIGSLGKLAVLTAACEAGLKADTKIMDTPQANGWPRNYDGISHGTVTVAETIEHSYNQAAVRIEQSVGVTKVVAAAHRLGFSEAQPALGTSLGVFDASVTDVASALAIVGNSGIRVHPYVVELVVGPLGTIVYDHRAVRQNDRAISSKCANMLRTVLTGVVTKGTASTAGFEEPTFGKTGTTSNSADAWFVGASHASTAAVWVGNRSPKAPMRGVTGGGLPARIVAQYFKGVFHYQRHQLHTATKIYSLRRRAVDGEGTRDVRRATSRQTIQMRASKFRSSSRTIWLLKLPS